MTIFDVQNIEMGNYEDGVLTEWTIDFEEGDEKWHEFMRLHGEIPLLVNVKMKKNG